MRCFCFKINGNDNDATEPTARPVATGTGKSPSSISPAIELSPGMVGPIVPSGISSGPGLISPNEQIRTPGTTETPGTRPATENAGTEHNLMSAYPFSVFRAYSNSTLLQYRRTNRHRRHLRLPHYPRHDIRDQVCGDGTSTYVCIS